MANNNEQNPDVIRTWKNEEYCLKLSEEERSKLPDNPVGLVELSNQVLELIAGGIIADPPSWSGGIAGM